jgi:hypothetical protein
MAAPSAAMRRKLQRKFRLRGFTLKVDALEEAAAFLDRFPDAEDDALDLLLDELDKEPRNYSTSPSHLWLYFTVGCDLCASLPGICWCAQ